jgi:hypothetical protein
MKNRTLPAMALAILDIDEKSLANMQKEAGRWPCPRVLHADLAQRRGVRRDRQPASQHLLSAAATATAGAKAAK